MAYAFYSGIQELTDEYGDYTGEYNVEYTEPINTLMNISGGRGQADIALFGLTQNFSRTATTQDLETPWRYTEAVRIIPFRITTSIRYTMRVLPTSIAE